MENVELVSKIHDLEKELVDSRDKITVLKVQLESWATNSASHPIPHSNSSAKLMLKSSLSNSNALPLNTTDARIQTVEVLSTLGESVQNFVAAMSDVHTYWEHRVKDLKAGLKLTDQSSQLSHLLLQNVKFLRPIEQSYQVSEYKSWVESIKFHGNIRIFRLRCKKQLYLPNLLYIHAFIKCLL